MNRTVSKQQLVTSIVILFWIFAVNVLSMLLLPDVPAWPMFFVTIFFFCMGGETCKVPDIFVGGLTGIVSAWGLIELLALLSPIVGETIATFLLLFFVLALIIVGGNYLPVAFNNVAFAYLTVAAIDLTIIESSVVNWLAMHLVGGTIILGGAVAIHAVVGKAFESTQEQATK